MGGNLYAMLNKLTAREKAYDSLTEPKKDELRQKWLDWEKNYPLCALIMDSRSYGWDNPQGFRNLVKRIEASNGGAK